MVAVAGLVSEREHSVHIVGLVGVDHARGKLLVDNVSQRLLLLPRVVVGRAGVGDGLAETSRLLRAEIQVDRDLQAKVLFGRRTPHEGEVLDNMSASSVVQYVVMRAAPVPGVRWSQSLLVA